MFDNSPRKGRTSIERSRNNTTLMVPSIFNTQKNSIGKQKEMKLKFNNEFLNLNSERNIERYFEKKKEKKPKLLADPSSSN